MDKSLLAIRVGGVDEAAAAVTGGSDADRDNRGWVSAKAQSADTRTTRADRASEESQLPWICLGHETVIISV